MTMSTRNGVVRRTAQRTVPAAADAARSPRPLRPDRAVDASRRALARWFGDVADPVAVPGDK